MADNRPRGRKRNVTVPSGRALPEGEVQAPAPDRETAGGWADFR